MALKPTAPSGDHAEVSWASRPFSVHALPRPSSRRRQGAGGAGATPPSAAGQPGRGVGRDGGVADASAPAGRVRAAAKEAPLR